MHMDDRLGSIEAGKYADLVILEKNLFDVPLDEIQNVKAVSYTHLDVYKRQYTYCRQKDFFLRQV